MENFVGPTRTKRGPYRKYLRDLEAPLPKTTLWRLKRNEQRCSGGPNPELNSTMDNSGSTFIDDSIANFNDSNQDHSSYSSNHDHSNSNHDDSNSYHGDSDSNFNSTRSESNSDHSDSNSDHGDSDSDSSDSNTDHDDSDSDHSDYNSDHGDSDSLHNDSYSDHNDDSDSESARDSSDLDHDFAIPDENMEIDENMFEPLYDGASITVCGAYCAIMEFKRVCRLPFTAIAMLLQLLQLLCPPANKLPRSVYVLKRFFHKYSSPHTTQRFCPECRTELEVNQRKCTNFGCRGKETDYLITLKPDRSIQTIVARNWEKLTQCIQSKGHLICDIYTGTGYQGPPRLEHVGAFFNTDGIQPFKSSRLSIWPVYIGLASLPPSIRMNRDNLVTLALWVGSKPPMHLLLKPLKHIMKRISSNGVHVRTPSGMKTVQLHPLFGVFDLVAKAPALNMHQFNGSNGCPTCLHPGESCGRTRVYLPGTYPLRTHDSMKIAAREAEEENKVVDGIKGKSALTKVVDLVNGIPIDYMHCVLEGVTKRLLKVWVGSTSCAGYIGRFVKKVDKYLLEQRPPHDFSRIPRSIEKHRKFWKASEFRNWLLYYSLPLLINVLPPLYLHHFSLLVCAMHILLQSQLSEIQIQAAEEMLVTFYELLPELYGDKNCTLNAHLLIHLTKYVRLWGPLWTTSAFGFESMNGYITSMIHSKHKVADQLLFSLDVSNTLSTLADKLQNESEQTLSFLTPTCGYSKSMSLILPGTYSVGIPQLSCLLREEQRAIRQLSGTASTQTLTFYRLYHQATMLYSVQYGREGGKRDSSVCCYVNQGVEEFGIIQKFCLCSNCPAVALIKPFPKVSTSLLKSIGNPGRDVLKSYAEIDVLSSFFVPVKRQLLPVCAVPLSQLVCKCVRISRSDLSVDHVVKIPNNYEHH